MFDDNDNDTDCDSDFEESQHVWCDFCLDRPSTHEVSAVADGSHLWVCQFCFNHHVRVDPDP